MISILMTISKYLLLLRMFCVLIILSVGICHADGHDDRSQWIAGGSYHTGFLINHHSVMRILNEQPPYFFEIFVAQPTDGSKPWHSFYRNPLYGVSCTVLYLGSPSYLGRAYGICPFLLFPLTDANRTLNLNLRTGTGIAYLEKPFDRFENYKNPAIGSHVNVLVDFRAEVRVRAAAPLHVSGGLSLSHISNGAFKKPNLGLNYVTVFAGASYDFGRERSMNPVEQTAHDSDRKWHYTVYLSGGIKTHSALEGIQYAVSGLSVEAFRQHLAFTRFNGALELFYDASDYACLVENDVKSGRIQTVKPALAAGYSFLFGRLAALVQAGGYLHAKNSEYGRIYQRLALSYTVANRLDFRLGLKTHWAQADYLELAIGYRMR